MTTLAVTHTGLLQEALQNAGEASPLLKMLY